MRRPKENTSVVGLDLSLTGAGICVLAPAWVPGGWEHMWSARIGQSLPNSATPAQRLERLEFIGDSIVRAIEPHIAEGPVFVALEDYSFGMAHKAHQLGELGGVIKMLIRIHFDLVAQPINHTTARKFLIGRGTAKGIKEEVTRKVQGLRGRGLIAQCPLRSSDEVDAFVIANYARSMSEKPALTFVG